MCLAALGLNRLHHASATSDRPYLCHASWPYKGTSEVAGLAFCDTAHKVPACGSATPPAALQA